MFVDIFVITFGFLWNWAPLWVPLFLLFVLWEFWTHYLQARTIDGKEWVMLEIKLPKEQSRSPRAMELLLNGFQDPGDVGDFVKKFWKGNIVPWASLEIVSIEGAIHFFFRVEKSIQHLVEAQIYSQYPDAEVYEVEDYTEKITYDEDKYSLWCSEYKLVKPDAYPIKTYVDYDLDKDPREEQKNDPMTPMLEFLGAVPRGAQVWIQIIIRKHVDKNRRKQGTMMGMEDALVVDAQAEIDKIKKSASIEGGEDGNKIALTPGQKDVIAAIERSISKLAFDVGIRTMYIGEQAVFHKPTIGGLVRSITNHNTNNLNAFKPGKKHGFTYPWQDPLGWREARNKREMFAAFRRRAYFHPPHKRKYKMVLNTEELATIYHFPGQIAATPTFKRIESRKSEPPTNLPM